MGLGHSFLRHVERSRVLVYIVDVSSGSGRDPCEDLADLRRELECYKEGMSQKVRAPCVFLM